MNDKKKVLLSVLGIFILLIAVFGVSFAFFSYLSTGSENSVQLGEIEFTSSTETMQLTNVFPTTLEEATEIATVSVQGYTTYEHGIDFTIKAVEVVPQNPNIIPTVVVERETVDGITYTDGGSATTTYDKNNRLTSDMVLCKGHVEGNKAVGTTDELVKLITISVYYDKDEYHISDNTKKELTDAGLLPSTYDGEVITTTDWNALNKDSEGNDVIAYSFKIQVTAVEGEEAASQDSLEYALVNSLNLTEPDVDGTKYVMTPAGYEATKEEAGGSITLNNYVTYSGKLWRIVSLNNDGIIKLVTNDIITESVWSSSNNPDYSTSTIRSYLISEFLPTLNDDLIVDSVWDYTPYESFPTGKLPVTKTIKEKVGLLSVYDYMMIGGNDVDVVSSNSFLDRGNRRLWTLSYSGISDENDKHKVWSIWYGYASKTTELTMSLGVQPSVVLKADIKVTGGTGAYGDPYTLEGDI